MYEFGMVALYRRYRHCLCRLYDSHISLVWTHTLACTYGIVWVTCAICRVFITLHKYCMVAVLRQCTMRGKGRGGGEALALVLAPEINVTAHPCSGHCYNLVLVGL